ncbi:major facilitator superfamily domain-containing protein [Schizophyllum amplum]|uniref:Major facilitator superfamily domain-containing protein n=1 Tax=Schizophyllum amplum TaxID=97359 RepID=A0A550CRM0_9AGAR|nr:major facilitator superfamily domain-containing protein [Auriculariopsis ampla]
MATDAQDHATGITVEFTRPTDFDSSSTIEAERKESAQPGGKETHNKESPEDEDWICDPVNPRNWTTRKKWSSVGVISLYTFIPPLTSSMMAPGLPEVALQYGITSTTILALTLSIFVLALALGPLVIGPLSEIFGRTWVLHISNLLSLAFNLGCAFAPTTSALIAFRFLSGLAGSASIAIGGGSISDLFDERSRGSAMALFTLGPLLGPVIGPVCGGFIAQSIGPKWVFIVTAILNGVAAVVGIPLLRETYHPVLRIRQAKIQGDVELFDGDHPQFSQAKMSNGRLFWVNIARPVQLLFGDIICFALSFYMAFVYGIYYLMFATFPEFFSTTYGFSAGINGLVYIGLGVGFFAATLVGAKYGNQVYCHLANKLNGGKGKPEYRIPSLIFGSLIVPIGLMWYGWSAQAKIHWIMPIIGSSIYGFGQMLTFFPIQLYLVDTFTYAASAVSAAAFFRSLFGFAFPLFAQDMFDTLGLGGGMSLLAGLSIVLGIPFPVYLWYNGEAMRARSSRAR